MRTCTICKIEKKTDEFNKNSARKDRLQTRCKVCDSELARANYHLKYKQSTLKRAYKRKDELFAWYQELKQKLSCSKCGDKRFYVLDFHHREKDDKFKSISNMIAQGFSKQRILDEMDKCNILCANCHRELHYLETA